MSVCLYMPCISILNNGQATAQCTLIELATGCTLKDILYMQTILWKTIKINGFNKLQQEEIESWDLESH